jgi:hypothetical protein
MGQVSPLPSRRPEEPLGGSVIDEPQVVVHIDSVRCGLCGARLTDERERFAVVSPRAADHAVTVCYLCRRAALGEGYRPAS